MNLPVNSGEVLLVTVRIAIDRDTQRVSIDGGQKVMEVLPDSPAIEANLVSLNELQLAVEEILKDYQFQVTYQGDSTQSAEWTQWELTLSIQIL